MNEIAIVSSEM